MVLRASPRPKESWDILRRGSGFNQGYRKGREGVSVAKDCGRACCSAAVRSPSSEAKVPIELMYVKSCLSGHFAFLFSVSFQLFFLLYFISLDHNKDLKLPSRSLFKPIRPYPVHI